MAFEDEMVAVVTPVYNGEPFLQECIQSVLNQTHRNFEYIIADNCSTDRSLEIARAAAESDSRITVVTGRDHVGPIQNWNRSLANVRDTCKFIKFVHADDWLYPQCISRMLEVAEGNERVAIVSSYRLEEDRVSLDRLPADAPLIPGTDTFTMDGKSVARAILKERASVLGSPSSTLLRVSAIQELDQYFSTEYLHADKDACLRTFQEWDFGFVRQVLVYTRRHNESVTSLTNTLDTRRQENLLFLQRYGSKFLSESEFEAARHRELRAYYQFLAANVATGKGRAFWDSHREVLGKAGIAFSRPRLVRAFLRRWTNPGIALKTLKRGAGARHRSDDSKAHGFLNMSRTEHPTKDDR